MKNKILSLPPDALSTIPLSHYPDNFTFVVNGTSFPTKRLIADLLSPKIRNYHLIDEACDQISIETRTKGNFSNILNIAIKGKQAFPNSEIKYVYEVLSQLDNFDFIDSTGFFSDEITVTNVFDKIDIKNSFRLDISEEISFLANHIGELSSKIKKLDINIIELILRNDHLLIENEDWLYEYVIKINTCLLECIKFSYLSEEVMNDFISTFDISQLNIGIWNSLCQRLKLKIDINSDIDSKRFKTQTLDIKYEGKGLKGIISYLSNQTKKSNSSSEEEEDLDDDDDDDNNINQKVCVTASSSYSSSYSPQNVLELDKDTLFGSRNQPDQWICFDFKDNLVQLKNYTIRSSNFWGPNREHPKSWVLECSNDKKRWKTIDKKVDCNELNEKGAIKTFLVENQHPKSRYFRLKQIGENCKGNYCFNISAVEFFGKLTLMH